MIIREMDQYAERTGVGVSTLGLRALNDPRFYHDVCRGREPKEKTVAKVRRYMADNP